MERALSYPCRASYKAECGLDVTLIFLFSLRSKSSDNISGDSTGECNLTIFDSFNQLFCFEEGHSQALCEEENRNLYLKVKNLGYREHDNPLEISVIEVKKALFCCQRSKY